jgi:hypothetical protein
MTLTPVNSMKLNPKPSSTQQPISEYNHPWYEYLNKPKPPTPEAVAKAQFVDKTYQWTGK